MKFFEQLEQHFVKSDKVEIITLLRKLVAMKYNGLRNVRKYVLEMSHIVSKLRALHLDCPEEVVVYFALMSLPLQFSYFEVSYNCQKEKLTVNKLISHLVQEEERMRQKKTESTNLASTSKG